MYSEILCLRWSTTTTTLGWSSNSPQRFTGIYNLLIGGGMVIVYKPVYRCMNSYNLLECTSLSTDAGAPTGYSGRRWKSFGLRMAGAKNLRKINPLTAVYCTTSSLSVRGRGWRRRGRRRGRRRRRKMGKGHRYITICREYKSRISPGCPYLVFACQS